MSVRVLQGDAIERLRELRDRIAHVCICSPPYFGLRAYLHDDHPDKHLEIGGEATPSEWVEKLVEVFREVRRVLRDDATLWINCGSSYAADGRKGRDFMGEGKNSAYNTWNNRIGGGYKPGDRIDLPGMLAEALRADGWFLRDAIVWAKCLSGGTWLYVRTQKGDMPMMVKDLVRLDPATVKLWNGEKWTQAVSWSRTPRPGNPVEIEFGSGERVGCTPEHLWPTARGNIRADELHLGDVVRMARLPERETPLSPAGVTDDLGWVVGLYLAEGCRGKDGKCTHFASHTKELDRFDRLRALAERFGGTFSISQGSPQGCMATVTSRVLGAIIDDYVAGGDAYTKRLTTKAWQRSNEFLSAVLAGYLEGDGHYEPQNGRWRLGFTRNECLARDLRAMAARLGYKLRLRPRFALLNGRSFPTWRGELRKDWSAHHNSTSLGEVVALRASRARQFWDIAVEDAPHLFSLSSGILTHNSSPMPESVSGWRWEQHRIKAGKDEAGRTIWRDCPGCPKCSPNDGLVLRKGSWRHTNSYEMVFHFAKSAEYFGDGEDVREAVSPFSDFGKPRPASPMPSGTGDAANDQRIHARLGNGSVGNPAGRNPRNVWTLGPDPLTDEHYAAFPREIPRRAILASTSARGCCPECQAPWARVVERTGSVDERGGERKHAAVKPRQGVNGAMATGIWHHRGTAGWRPTCACVAGDPIPCTVLDCFAGSGTTGVVAEQLGRDAILIELSAEYATMIERRLAKARARRLLGQVERVAPLPGQGHLFDFEENAR